jgi:hypothetical protein
MQEYAFSPKKRAAAQALAERKPDQTLAAVAAIAGCAEHTLYEYLKDPEFCETVRELTAKTFARWVPMVDRVLLKQALDGVPSMVRLFYERAGELGREPEGKEFKQFLKRLEDAELEEAEFYAEHGYWPDEEGPRMMDEPEGPQ